MPLYKRVLWYFFFSVILYKIKAYLVKPQKNQHQEEEKANLFPED